MPPLEELLARSAPSVETTIGTEAALDALVLEARRAVEDVRARRRRRKLWLLPGSVLVIGALTAGASIVSGALDGAGGGYTYINEPVSVHWTTDTGKYVECEVVIGGSRYFEPKLDQVVDYYRTHDFSDTGQRIYEYALVLSGAKKGTQADLPKSSIWIPTSDFDDDKGALAHSMALFLVEDVMFDLGLNHAKVDGTQGGLYSDCLALNSATGKLH